MRCALLTFACTAVPLALAAAPANAQLAYAQVPLSIAAPETVAASSVVSSSAAADNLPDSPGATATALPADGLAAGLSGEGQAPTPQAISPNRPVAKKYTSVILPGQGAVRLSAGDKFVFSVVDSISPFSILGSVISATYSQGVNSEPNYGQGWGPYGQRVGASVARGTVQNLAAEGILAGLFHDDPRYYMLGDGHKFINRAIYAGTRAIITRSDDGHKRINAPLLLGYVAAAGVNFAYYPQRNRNFHDAATGYAGSIGGAALGFEASEFLDDALRLIHFHHGGD